MTVSDMKELGVTMKNNLKSKNHVDNITASANLALFTIKRTMTFLNANTGPPLQISNPTNTGIR
jgi:hypothetical protein